MQNSGGTAQDRSWFTSHHIGVQSNARSVNITQSKQALKRSLAAAVVGMACSPIFAVGPASAQDAAEISRQVVNSAVQSVIQSIRNRLQSAPGAAAEPDQLVGINPLSTTTGEDSFFGIARSSDAAAISPTADLILPGDPVFPSRAPVAAVWAAGSLDRQETTVAGFESTAKTWAGVAGADITQFGVFDPSDALVLGVFGSYSETRSDGTKAETPGVGGFLAYVIGGFSTDFSVSGNFTDQKTEVMGVSVESESESISFSGNLNYRIDLANYWWIEPTVGSTYTVTFVDGPGDGETVQIQGGARLGTQFWWDQILVQPTFTGLAYSNVMVEPSSASSDEGQVWLKGVAKLNFVFTDQFSAYVEGNVRGTEGDVDALGYGGQVGVRLVF